MRMRLQSLKNKSLLLCNTKTPLLQVSFRLFLLVETKIDNPLSPTLEVKSPTTPNEVNSLISKKEEPQSAPIQQDEVKIEEPESFDEGVNQKFGNIYMYFTICFRSLKFLDPFF